MEEFVVYILYSETFNKNYTGFTSNLMERFKSHNHLGTKGYTLKFRPWMVIHVEFFSSKSEAMKREKYLKTGIGREFIKNLINNL
ncbi:GIY-YIG nuclease family protein [Flavobacterium circumlabens]|uniref:Endonuclease n=1 Tax=Flavobacterium circumlabens TaxID=2133765 RepID=A0A4Y7UAX4_9FLAO|nr:GIY-YIG nuclease family protein [Flavobacterium circumlabens]TCN56554.1 putative endonuclease [Flavobacterium circumlabens]TEB43570.1 GIY-YIG nuclease family protein [Flavobacterium circumlabens]